MLISLIAQRAFLFSKFTLHKGKYLIPEPPKRALSSYIIFSNQLRTQLAKQTQGPRNVTETSKIIGQKWKQISEEEKKKYEEKSAQIKKKAQVDKMFYEKKYVEPFKNWTLLKLIQKEVKDQNPQGVGGLAGFQAKVKEYRQSLTPERTEELQKQVKKLNQQNLKIVQQYQVPQLEIKTFVSYLNRLRKNDPNIPKKSEIQEIKLRKYEASFEIYKEDYITKMKNFAALNSIKMAELEKILGKSESPVQKITKKIISEKQVTEKQMAKAKKAVESKKKTLKNELEKLKNRQKKQLEKTKKNLKQKLSQTQAKVTKLGTKADITQSKLKKKAQDLKLKTIIQKQVIGTPKKGRKVKASNQTVTEKVDNPLQSKVTSQSSSVPTQ